MRATITADAGRGPGCAVIVIADAPETAGPAFLLRRASDQKSLTTAGWQENETRLSPDHWERQGADLRLLVGPAVVDALDDLDAYRLTLVNAAPCVLQVGPLVYSPMRGGHGLADAAPTPAPDPEPEPAPSPTPEPAAPPEEAAPAEPTAEGLNASDAPPLALEPEAPAPRRNLPLLLILGLLLLAILAFALWWFALRGPVAPSAPAATADTPAARGSTDAAAPAQQQAEQAQSTPAQQSPLHMAREMLRGQAQPEQSLSAAGPLRTPQASPEQSDAAFLLLEDAAQKGNAAAMYMVAQFYDPQSRLPRGSLPVDLTQARRWYEAALQKGHAEARPALDALRAYAKTQADKGDAEAAALLQDWK